MTSLTRGPLPARVYWRRRIVVLGSALLLVFAIARVLTGGSDASSNAEQAAQVAADPTPTSTTSAPTAAATTAGPHRSNQPGKGRTSQAPVLAQPDGPCADEDIAVSPDVKDPVAGRDVSVVLHLRTLTDPACTWRVTPDTLTMKITSGKDDIWSSRECPRAITRESVVVRNAVDTTVKVVWNAKRSDDRCSRLTEWALPGYYHLEAAALAGEPADVQFELKAPTGPVVTRSPQPEQQHGGKNGGRPKTGESPSDSGSDSATAH